MRSPMLLGAVVSLAAAAKMTLRAEPRKELLVTTGYWRLDNAASDSGTLRNGPGGYLSRMHMVMSLNVPIAIYGDKFGLEKMRQARGNVTPAIVGEEEVLVESMQPCKSHGPEMRANVSKYTHPLHMHSITLACIWDGKFSLVAQSARKHPGYAWYAWLDIGMHGGPEMDKVFKAWGAKPWPSASKLAMLPRDKISASRTASCLNFEQGRYLPFGHCVAATAYIIPGHMVEEVAALFYEQLELCLETQRDQDESYPCLSEQVIMSHMEVARPGLYNFIGRGYGTIAGNLTSDFAYTGFSDLFTWLGADEAQATTMLAAGRRIS